MLACVNSIKEWKILSIKNKYEKNDGMSIFNIIGFPLSMSRIVSRTEGGIGFLDIGPVRDYEVLIFRLNRYDGIE